MKYVRPDIVAMAGYVPGEQPQAGKFIKLNTNENPYPPSEGRCRPSDRRPLTVWPATRIRSPRPFACAPAQLLGVDPDWILCGNGSDDILTIVTRALVGSGQWLRLPYPSYVLYKTLAQIQGAAVEEVHFQPDWSLPERFAARPPSCGWSSCPIRTAPRARRSRRSRCCGSPRRCPARCWWTRPTPTLPNSTASTWSRSSEKIMVSRTLSKSYALAGLRFGYLVAQPQLIEQLLKVKDSYNCDALSIAGATAAIDDQALAARSRASGSSPRGPS